VVKVRPSWRSSLTHLDQASLIAAKFNESGEVLDKAAKQEVIDYLDFVGKPVKAGSREGS